MLGADNFDKTREKIQRVNEDVRSSTYCKGAYAKI